MRIFVIFFIIIIILGWGCVREVSQAPDRNISLPTPEQTLEFVEVAAGIERLKAEPVVLFRFAFNSYRFEFVHLGPPGTVEQWASALPEAAAVINGVYFHENGLPSGLLIDEGERVGDRVFDYVRTGLLVLDPEVDLIDTSVEVVDESHLIEAAQSYPFLILDGKPAVDEESGLIARRSFFGLDRKGNVYLGVVPDEEVSLYELSLELAALDIDWDAVLNLDGGPSSGLVVGSEAVNSLSPVPNVIIAERIEK